MSESLIKELFVQGHRALRAKHDQEESTKVGTLRGGSCGLVFEDGKVASNCASLVYLRFQGIDISCLSPDRATRELMFEAGRTNEDSWFQVLANSGYQGTIKRESEIPISWELANGVKVTGRPDMVLCSPEPELGIELKLVSSLWTARSVKINLVPKMPHLCQAGHYSWKLGVPFEIWYTSRTDIEASPDFHQKDYPAYQEYGSDAFTYRFYEHYQDGGFLKKRAITEEEYQQARSDPATASTVSALVGKYLPFVQGFQLAWDADGWLSYSPIDAQVSGVWTKTIISQERLQRFYELVSSLKTVPKEPLSLKASGAREGYKLSTYCSLGKLCCRYQAGRDIQEWANEVKVLVGNSSPSSVNT